jgi:hypothetical protein
VPASFSNSRTGTRPAVGLPPLLLLPPAGCEYVGERGSEIARRRTEPASLLSQTSHRVVVQSMLRT